MRVKKNVIGSAFCLCMVLSIGVMMLLVGCSEDSESSESASLSTMNVSDETNEPGNTIGAYIQPISATADNEKYETEILSDDEISEVYTFTLEGKTYTLPCPAQEFVQAGWAPAEELVIAAKHYSSEAIVGGGFYLNGDDTRRIGLQLVNTSDADAVWSSCTVVGITVLGDAFDFETSRGVRVGDEFAATQDAYGASSYETDRYGTIGYHFAATADPEMDGARWYGQPVDTLTFLSTTKTLYEDWTAESFIDTIRMENFGDIEPGEAD